MDDFDSNVSLRGWKTEEHLLDTQIVALNKATFGGEFEKYDMASTAIGAKGFDDLFECFVIIVVDL